MNIIEGIMTRTSIRKFTGEKIKDEDLETIIKAACQAPSAHNRQPWEFIVMREDENLKKIKGFHPYAKMVVDAGTAIVVCGDMEKQDNKGFLTSDVSAAIQNMLLAAHGLNLGAVWCGLYDVDFLVDNIREICKLPENILPIGIVVVGNKEKAREASPRYDEGKIHYEKW